MGRLYVEYWRHTGDRDFLRTRALPFLREAAEFYAALPDRARRAGAASRRPTPPRTRRATRRRHRRSVNATMDVVAVRGLLRDLVELRRRRRRWRGGGRSWTGCRRTGSTPTAAWPSGCGPGWPTTTPTGTPRTCTGCGTTRTRTCSTTRRCGRRPRRRSATGWRGGVSTATRWRTGSPSSAWPPPRSAWPTRRTRRVRHLAARYWRPSLVPDPQRRRNFQHRCLW